MRPLSRKFGAASVARWLSVGLVILSLTILAGYWATRVANFARLEEATLLDMERRAMALTSAVAEQTRSVVYNLDLALRHLQHQYAAKGQIGDEDARAVQGATPPGLVRRVMMIDASGHVAHAYPAFASGELPWLGDRAYFKAHDGEKNSGLFVGHPVQSRFTGEWLIPLSRALRDGRGRFAGVVMLTVAPEHFAEIYGRLAAGRDDIIALVHRDGTFLSRSAALDEYIGKSARPDRPFIGDQAPESGVFRSISTYEPVDRVFAFRRLPEWPLIAVVGLGVSETITPLRASRVKDLTGAMVVSVLVLLLVGGVCWVLLRLERNVVRLSETEDRLALAFAGAAELAWEWDLPQRQVGFFGDCAPLLGQAAREVKVSIDDWFERIHPDDRQSVRTRTAHVLKTRGDGFEIEYRVRHADRSWFWVLVRGRTAGRDAGGHIVRLIGIVMDVDANKRVELQAAQTRESYARLIENAGEGIFVVDGAGRIEIFNPAAERLLGWTAGEVQGQLAHQLFHLPAPGEAAPAWPECPVARTLADGLPRRRQRLNYRHKDGRPVPVELSIAPTLLGGKPAGAVVLIADVAERLAWEGELERLARTDTLTGAFNRRYFVELVEREFHRAERDAAPLSLLMLDLDHFKRINDSHGHAAGDAVLIAVARCCLDELRQIDVFGRLGGEEFGVTLPGVGLSEAKLVADRLRRRIAGLDVAVNDGSIRCTVSIGVATRRSGEDLDSVLARADVLLYAAKDAGRDRSVAEAEAQT